VRGRRGEVSVMGRREERRWINIGRERARGGRRGGEKGVRCLSTPSNFKASLLSEQLLLQCFHNLTVSYLIEK